MSTRGLYGFRKNGVDKTTYNHFDSYPSGLGETVVRFCMTHSADSMRDMFDKIILVTENVPPTEEQINRCVSAGWYNGDVSTQTTHEWYCLLRELQGELDKLYEAYENDDPIYMIDDHTFIQDSLFCEHAYIINLDTGMLEYWQGFQHEPQLGNRYGEERDGKYYPCALMCEFPLDDKAALTIAVAAMNAIEDVGAA